MAAEIQWNLLPPLTVATESLVVSAVLEPAYDVAGDSFDYAVTGETAHLAIFDAMGHGLASALFASVAVAAYRNAPSMIFRGRTASSTRSCSCTPTARSSRQRC